MRVRGCIYNEIQTLAANAMWLKDLPEVSLYGKVDLSVSHGVENALHECVIDKCRISFDKTAIDVVTALL